MNSKKTFCSIPTLVLTAAWAFIGLPVMGVAVAMSEAHPTFGSAGVWLGMGLGICFMASFATDFARAALSRSIAGQPS